MIHTLSIVLIVSKKAETSNEVSAVRKLTKAKQK